MSTSAAPPRKFTDAQRREIVGRLLASGQSTIEFARTAGISVYTLRGWRLALAPDSPRPARPAFVEIAARPEPDAAHPIEVALPRGLAVRVVPGFDSDTLRRVVDSLIA